jgi:hypothetical protein
MRSHQLLWLLAILAALSACSLLVDFDPEGQPCDVHKQCLPDYVCRDGGCVSSPGAQPDGGVGKSSPCLPSEPCAEPLPQAR